MSANPFLPPSSGPSEPQEPISASAPSPAAPVPLTGKWGPVLVLGGVLLSAGLIVHFDKPGSDASGKGAAAGSLNPENSSLGARPRANAVGATIDESPAGVSRAFLDSPHYKAALSVAGMPDGPTRAEAMEALIETWAASAPKDAADWAGSLPAGNFRDDALSAVMFHWGLSSPADAAAWMARTGIDDPEAASVLAGRWAAQDAASAAVWSEKLTDPVLRQDAINAVAGAWGERAPEAAASWVAGLPAGDKAAAAATLMAAWAETSPEAAASWLARQQEAGQESQTPAVAVLATYWAEKNPGAASRFVNSLPEGPVREAASSQFAVAAAPTAPAEALTWAMNLADPVQRNQVVADAAESWYDGAPEGFRAGISDALALMDDPAMRKGVYEMLYERDAGFHDNLLKLIEPASPAQAAATLSSPSPAAAQPAPFVPGTSPAAYLNSGVSSAPPGPFFPGQVPIPDTVPATPDFTGSAVPQAAAAPSSEAEAQADPETLFPDDSGEADSSGEDHSN